MDQDEKRGGRELVERDEIRIRICYVIKYSVFNRRKILYAVVSILN